MDELLQLINKCPNGTRLIIKLESGVEIKGRIDTIYETNNGLEMDDENYQEYYACAFEVLAILNFTGKKSKLCVGRLIEISMQDPPLKVMSEDGITLWEQK